jgi:hypothetical protein
MAIADSAAEKGSFGAGGEWDGGIKLGETYEGLHLDGCDICLVVFNGESDVMRSMLSYRPTSPRGCLAL